jgi:uncharacterized protein (DUF1501 family)
MHKGMAFHPALKGFARMQQNGDLRLFKMWAIPILHVLIFEVKKFGNRSNQEYLNDGWLGRYLICNAKNTNPQ